MVTALENFVLWFLFAGCHITAVFEMVGTRELRRVEKNRPSSSEDLSHIFPRQRRNACPSNLGSEEVQQWSA